MREVEDYEQYFLVIDRRGNFLTDARRVPRVNVSTYTIGGFTSDWRVVPAQAKSTVAAVVNDLVANPTATVRIECADPDPHLAKLRVEVVQNAILSEGSGRKGFGFRSDKNFNLVGVEGAIPLAVITVDRPDTEAEAERGRLVEKWLTGRSERRAPQKRR